MEKEHVTFSVLDDWTAFEKFVLHSRNLFWVMPVIMR